MEAIELTKILGSKNQVVLDKELVDHLDLQEGDLLHIRIRKFGQEHFAKGLVRLTKMNRVTVPKDVVQVLSLVEGDAIDLEITKEVSA